MIGNDYQYDLNLRRFTDDRHQRMQAMLHPNLFTQPNDTRFGNVTYDPPNSRPFNSQQQPDYKQTYIQQYILNSPRLTQILQGMMSFKEQIKRRYPSSYMNKQNMIYCMFLEQLFNEFNIFSFEKYMYQKLYNQYFEQDIMSRRQTDEKYGEFFDAIFQNFPYIVLFEQAFTQYLMF